MNTNLNRRDFLKVGGSALAAATLPAPGLAAAENPTAPRKRKSKKPSCMGR